MLLTEKQSVCALIHTKSGKIVGVSRKDNPKDFGLPGGKVDEGENLHDAIKREVLEETGLKVKHLLEVFKDVENCYSVTTFLCIVDEDIDFKKINITNPKETGIVKEINWEILTNKKTSSFYEYNSKLYVAYLVMNSLIG